MCSKANANKKNWFTFRLHHFSFFAMRFCYVRFSALLFVHYISVCRTCGIFFLYISTFIPSENSVLLLKFIFQPSEREEKKKTYQTPDFAITHKTTIIQNDTTSAECHLLKRLFDTMSWINTRKQIILIIHWTKIGKGKENRARNNMHRKKKEIRCSHHNVKNAKNTRIEGKITL